MGSLIRLTFTADRFLRHMVRMLVGTMVRVGTGRLPEGAPKSYLSAPPPGGTGPTVPAHGLYLVRVDYGFSCCPTT